MTMGLRPAPVVGFVGAAVVGGAGAAAFTYAGRVIIGAVTQIRDDRARYDLRYDGHLARATEANEHLRTYGRTQERSRHEVTDRMRDFLTRINLNSQAYDDRFLDGVDPPPVRVAEEPKLNLDVEGWVQGLVNAARAGATTKNLVHQAVTQLARAGTGRPISELYGAAQKSAEDAFLGGGPKSLGGGGRDLGAKVRIAIVAGTTVAAASVAAVKQATQTRTDADRHHTQVTTAIADLDLCDEVLRGVGMRAQELDETLTWLTGQATVALDLLESEPFDRGTHDTRLHAALKIAAAVGEVRRAPIIDRNGDLDPQTEKLVFKYRTARKETPDA
ncbi:hypothetical protein ABT369_50035 [Dactylosporangium sp. NPDC000244]|uniref:hypothetical protein n=1 Tax=Dactylosporangium sp. NPDC000244 TaxID=3154365 RepID=UPI0033256E4F